MIKSKYLLTILLSGALLASCNNPTTDASGNTSSTGQQKEYTKDESIVKIDNLDLSLYEMYDLNYMIKDTFSKDHSIVISSENEQIVSPTEENMLFSSDLGL